MLFNWRRRIERERGIREQEWVDQLKRTRALFEAVQYPPNPILHSGQKTLHQTSLAKAAHLETLLFCWIGKSASCLFTRVAFKKFPFMRALHIIILPNWNKFTPLVRGRIFRCSTHSLELPFSELKRGTLVVLE